MRVLSLPPPCVRGSLPETERGGRRAPPRSKLSAGVDGPRRAVGPDFTRMCVQSSRAAALLAKQRLEHQREVTLLDRTHHRAIRIQDVHV
jgi:hypothetical protein